MYKKRALVLGGYLSLLALAACGPKVIDDSDLVSIDYKYTFSDWSVVEQWNKDFVVWDAGDLAWIEDIVRWAEVDAEFKWKINWKELYGAEYDSNDWQSYPLVVMKNAMQIDEPEIWMEVNVGSFWTWVIVRMEKDSDWADTCVVEFNNPKTYSDLSYTIKVTNIEKK